MSESASAVPIRRFLGESAIYGLGGIIPKCVGLVLLPISTAYLAPADYGILGLFSAHGYVLYVALSAGLPHAFLRFYTEAPDSRERRKVLDTCFWIGILFSVAWLTPLVLFRRPLAVLLFQLDAPGYVLLLAAVTFLGFVDEIGCRRLQADGKPWTYLAVRSVNTLLVRGLGIWLIVLGHGPWGWIVGEAVGLCVSNLLLAGLAYKDLGRSLDAGWARLVLPYGAALVPGMLAHWVMTGSDKYLLAALLDNPHEPIGLYTVAERISSIMQLANVAVLLGWRRFAFVNIHHSQGPALLARAMMLFVLLGGFLALSLALLGDDLTHWVISNRQFEAGVKVIPPLVAAGFLAGVAEMVSIGLLKARRTWQLSLLNTLAAALNVGLNLLYIPKYGIAGAAASTLFCHLLKAAWTWRASQRWLALPLDYRRLAAAVAILLVTFALGQLLIPFGWAVAGLGQMALLLAITPALVFCAGPDERQRLLSLLKKTA